MHSHLMLSSLVTYLTENKVKINNSFNSWTDLIQVVPQRSVPLLCNIYLNNLFFTLKNTDVCNCADNTTTYVCDDSIKKVLKLLEEKLNYLHVGLKITI